jgi:uncharacterized repeat protein (TIGR03803 family)
VLRSSSAKYKVLYRFTGGADGHQPAPGLIQDATGALYGATTFGGGAAASGGGCCGTIFRFDPATRNKTVLYTFLGGSDGQEPSSPIEDKTGALYGTTYSGGDNNNDGTVYKLTPSSAGYSESILYRFKGGIDGANPSSALKANQWGGLFGVTVHGGTNGLGTVFRLTPTSSGYVETILYSFKGGRDGATPRATILMGAAGDLYGTTLEGGGGQCLGIENGPAGCGTVYELVRSSGYAERVLYRFQGGLDGANPYGGIIADSHGSLYGTTGNGGSFTGCVPDAGGKGCGTAFKLTRTNRGYAEIILHRFKSVRGGHGPGGNLVIGSNGQLYGATLVGGEERWGTLFALTPTSKAYQETVLYTFTGLSDGANPLGSLTIANNGDLVGTTQGGGTSGDGTLFELAP